MRSRDWRPAVSTSTMRTCVLFQNHHVLNMLTHGQVGGEHLEAAINAINPFGRIVACGMISQYNLKPEDGYPIRNLMQVVAKRLKIQGFIVGDENMGPKYHKKHQETVQKWINEGSYKPEMSITYGIDNAAEGLLGLFEGKNFGKAVLEIAKL